MAALASPAATAHASAVLAAAGDRDHTFFATDEPLIPSLDTDSAVDVYVRSPDALRLATAGDPSCRPGCGNANIDVDATGGIHWLGGAGLLFSTAEALVPADADGSVDVYRHSSSGLELVTQGPAGSSGPFDAELGSWSDGGSMVVFSTAEGLVGSDTDDSVDVYRRSGATTELISHGPNGFNGEFDADWATTAGDGSAIFFLTAEPLVGLDLDTSVDLYENGTEGVRLVSYSPGTSNGEFDVEGPVFTTQDGARTVFSTAEAIRVQDEDETLDVYMSFGGTLTVVSEGTYDPLLGEHPVELHALDPNANRVIFATPQVITEKERDTAVDLYEWYYGITRLVSVGPAQPFYTEDLPAEFAQFVPGDDSVIFSTTEKLVFEDNDASLDVYRRGGMTTTLISRGPVGSNGPFPATFGDASADGSRLLFTTSEQISTQDLDASVDLFEYDRDLAMTTLVSGGKVNGNGPFDVGFLGGTEPPLFRTLEQLVPADTDAQPDLYGRIGGSTQLLSTAKPPPPAPTITASVPPSPSNLNEPSLQGSAEAGATVELFATADCTGPPLAEGSAASFASPGLAAGVVPDDSATDFYVRAVDGNNVPGPCSPAFTYVEDSTPPAPATLTSVDPPGPANQNRPRVRGAAEAGTTVQIFSDPGCAGPAFGHGAAAELSGPGIAVPVPDDSVTSFHATAIDSAGNASGCTGAVAYREDSTSPTTSIRRGPRGRTRTRRARFAFGASEPASRFVCRLGRRPRRRCGGFFTLWRVGLGRHRLTVAAVDLAGNVDPTPVVRAWRVVRKRRRKARKRAHSVHRRPARQRGDRAAAR